MEPGQVLTRVVLMGGGGGVSDVGDSLLVGPPRNSLRLFVRKAMLR